MVQRADGIFLIYGSCDHYMELIWAIGSFWSKFPSGWGPKFIRTFSGHLRAYAVNWKVNCGFWMWKLSFFIPFMSKTCLLIIPKIKVEEFEVKSKVSKNGKWPIISTFQKWQVFDPTSTQLSNIKEASNEFLSNMKVEYLSLPFPKSPRSWASDEWLRRYGPIIAKCAWNFKWP